MEVDIAIRCELQNRFQIRRLLGKGSFGNVYECMDNREEQLCALKIISKINVKRTKIQTLKQEAKLLKELSHKNIIKIFEYGELDSCVYIKMELAKGGTLQGYIQKKKKQPSIDEEIASVMGQIMRGLSYIHSLSIIHRDLKPDNILLVQNDSLSQIKIADFGLSTKLDFHYPKSAIAKCGTLLFMAPEILCKYAYTKAIDIWSVAVIMFIMFSRSHPIWKDKMTTQQYTLVVSKVTALPGIKANELAQDFFNRISKVDPKERYTAQQSLKHPWITRRFNDPIPLSVHESYSSFETGSDVVKMIKILLAVKILSKPVEQIPKAYHTRIANEARARELTPSLKLKKLKSLNLEKQSLLSSLNSIVEKKQEKKPQGGRPRLQSQSDNQNPTINKLNQIFNTLFDKKITSKGRISYRQKQPKESTIDFPSIENFRQSVQLQIQKTVIQCLENRNKSKRILPIKSNSTNQINSNVDERADLTLSTKGSFIRKSKKKKIISDLY